MGGDYGPRVTVPAALKSLQSFDNLELILVGDPELVAAQLAIHDASDHQRITVVPSSQIIEMDESPSSALRSKKDSSMRVAINCVKEGKASACVSAGNTGALMVIARFVLKTLEGVDRPAILSRLPTVNCGEFRILDLGANVDSSPQHLFQFAVMGSEVAKAIDGNDRPRVALLNIGEEEIKGNELVKEAHTLLTNCAEINYIGYIESDSMFNGDVDVVVCDGFVGNVALKTAEGAAKLFQAFAKQSFTTNWLTKLGALVAKPALKIFKDKIDPGKQNGATFIGLKGIVIKSHGGADEIAFYHAIEEAVREVAKNVPDRIKQQVALLLTSTDASE